MDHPVSLWTYRPTNHDCVAVGIDLAGLEHRETGIAVLRGGRLTLLTSANSDSEILSLAPIEEPNVTLAVNAPLTVPRGRCCLDDDCPCRHDPGTRSREIERTLLRMRVPILATALIKVLARRGSTLALALRQAGCEPLEVYPYATLRLLGLPTQGKRTQLGRRRIHQALQPLVPGLDHPEATEHQLDAVVCALTADLWRQGLATTVGAEDEGLMVIPDPDAIANARALSMVAESRALYHPSGTESHTSEPPEDQGSWVGG